MQMGIIGMFLGAVVLMILVIYIKANMKICAPNEVMIFSGRRFKAGDGGAGHSRRMPSRVAVQASSIPNGVMASSVPAKGSSGSHSSPSI